MEKFNLCKTNQLFFKCTFILAQKYATKVLVNTVTRKKLDLFCSNESTKELKYMYINH